MIRCVFFFKGGKNTYRERYIFLQQDDYTIYMSRKKKKKIHLHLNYMYNNSENRIVATHHSALTEVDYFLSLST